MSVSATISSGTPTVGGSLTCSGQATGGESLTGYQWQSADGIGGTYSNISGATSQSWSVVGAYRCKFVRCQVAFDDSGNTVYAYTDPLKIGPCGGGGGVKAASKAAQAPAVEQAVVPRAARRIVQVDVSKWGGAWAGQNRGY